MKRRAFIAALGGAATAWPLAIRAQRASKLVRIGVLASLPLPPLVRLSQKLKKLGYIEGETIRFVYRFAEGHDDRYPILAAELVALPADVIVTWGTPAALAAKAATNTIPIVMGSIGEPVSTGIVSSLARPDGNITGFASVNVELEGKRLELLKALIPNLSRVGILANSANPFFEVSLTSLQPAADTLRLSLDIFKIREVHEIESALLKLTQAHPDAVLVAADTLLLNRRREIVEALARSNLPAIYPFREYAEVGGLIVYGTNFGVLFERAATYVDRILKGAKPGDLPVQLATEFELIINLKTAAGLGLMIPPSMMVRANEVIE
jgi:putative ABC transport system substrate-binding protein